jgi:TM2 domain-containing membrane protein YozV
MAKGKELVSTMSDMVPCPFCEAEIPETVQKCRFCGEWVSRDCLVCGTPIKNQWAARGYCAECESKAPGAPPGQLSPVSPGTPPVQMHPWPMKSRSVSIGLALVFGGFGAHKIYLDKPGKGLLYMMFCWTGIPTLLGIVDAVKYIRMEDEEFQRRFITGQL